MKISEETLQIISEDGYKKYQKIKKHLPNVSTDYKNNQVAFYDGDKLLLNYFSIL